MIKKFSPAKINLFLHVTGKTHENYHILESLVTFANFGDWITIHHGNSYQLTITGPYAEAIETDQNIITTAVNMIADHANIAPNLSITLEKNIPIGAGLGGGSSNAAAVIHALIEFLELNIDSQSLNKILLNLGADVPMCFKSKTSIIRGIGEKITPIEILKPLHAVLIFPNKHCSTADIFAQYKQPFSSPLLNLKESISDKDIFSFLKTTNNDLTNAAINNIPEIKSILVTLKSFENCILSRMTGSGSCCFGLFSTEIAAQRAAEKIQKENPHWWARAVSLNN